MKTVVVNQGDLILVEQAFMYGIVELRSALDFSDYYASSLDLSWLADPEPFPTRRKRAKAIMKQLLEQLPEWWQAVNLRFWSPSAC